MPVGSKRFKITKKYRNRQSPGAIVMIGILTRLRLKLGGCGGVRL